MASIIAYYRPRGMEGNYKVGILLDLLPTERAKVFRREEYKHDPTVISGELLVEGLGLRSQESSPLDKDLLKPIKTTVKTQLMRKGQRKIEIYVLSRFTSNPNIQKIVIEIYDTEIAEHQTDEFRAKSKKIKDEEVTYGVKLNKITIIDLDNTDRYTAQKYKSEMQEVRQTMDESSN